MHPPVLAGTSLALLDAQDAGGNGRGGEHEVRELDLGKCRSPIPRGIWNSGCRVKTDHESKQSDQTNGSFLDFFKNPYPSQS